MKIAMLLLAAAFCIYGFVASFEPGPNHFYWRIGYAAMGLGCLAAAAWMARRR
jgi:hypothetical protein